jgi:ribosomal protein L7/L12
MANTPPDGRFAVILPSLNGYPLEEIRDRLAELFSVLKSTAERILKSAPIVLLEDASAQEAEYIRNLLGIELTVQPISQVNGNFPRLSWPKRPTIRIPAEAMPEMSLIDGDEAFGKVEYVEAAERVMKINFEGGAPASTSTAASVKAPAAQQEQKALYGNGKDTNDIFVYNVFLAKVTSEGKRERAIELISKIRGVSILEAEEVMDRTIVPIIKGVTKKEAEEIQEMFKRDRIAVQILKKPK